MNREEFIIETNAIQPMNLVSDKVFKNQTIVQYSKSVYVNCRFIDGVIKFNTNVLFVNCIFVECVLDAPDIKDLENCDNFLCCRALINIKKFFEKSDVFNCTINVNEIIAEDDVLRRFICGDVKEGSPTD